MTGTDPTVAKAQGNAHALSPQQKLETAVEIIKDIKTAMLTSRAPDGKLASRAMQPTHVADFATRITFWSNLDSGKHDDIESDPNVNIAFLDPKSGDWVSVAGKASLDRSDESKKRHWSKAVSAWFDKRNDKEDGSHTDPRAVLLHVIPDEIRAFHAHGKLKLLAETAKAAIGGDAAAGGQLIHISSDELALARKVQA